MCWLLFSVAHFSIASSLAHLIGSKELLRAEPQCWDAIHTHRAGGAGGWHVAQLRQGGLATAEGGGVWFRMDVGWENHWHECVSDCHELKISEDITDASGDCSFSFQVKGRNILVRLHNLDL